MSQRRVLVLNGPNLGRLGRREPDIYGTTTHAQLAQRCRDLGAELGLDVEVRQSDAEGELLGWLGEAADTATPVVLNAGALSHYSYALRDAVAAVDAPVVEVHLSNTARRESFRHTSVLTEVCTGTILGLGVDGYLLALRYLAAAPRPA